MILKFYSLNEDILHYLGLKEDDIDRFRFIEIQTLLDVKEQFEEAQGFIETLNDKYYIVLHTRTGGNNEISYIKSNMKLAQHTRCLAFFSDNFDNTYMWFIFSVNAEDVQI